MLQIEVLEERRILDAAPVASALSEAAPWQNPTNRLDANNDGLVNTSDMFVVINSILRNGSGPLDPPTDTVTTFVDVTGDNRLNTSDMQTIINALLLAPTVEVSTLTTFTVDVTPQVTVTATPRGTTTIADGTIVILDVDLNNDGDFTDPNETSFSQSTTFEGKSVFSLTQELPRSDEVYTVNLQARVKNDSNVQGRSTVLPLVVDTLTSDALKNYVNTFDPSYSYRVVATVPQSIPGLGTYTYYAVDMTSQTWRSEADVNIPVWRHKVGFYVPSGSISGTAMLLIDGGSNGNLDTPDPPVDLLGQAAITLGSVIIDLKGVPNEPVIFTDETSSRSEDDIIAYSFDKFLTHIGEPGNDTWPVLVAMVKSAVRAMDTAQDLIPDVKFGASISDFLVTGYSKRGWTTWLTSAIDDRVRAMIPGVFDNLNQGPQMVHHYGAYGFFSQAVQPYNEMQIFDRILTPEAMLMSRIVDPYTYLNNGRFDNMPKLIINSTGDEFFVSDSAQYYFDDIPGNKNYLLYIPNTGHGLDLELSGGDGNNSQVAKSTVTFLDAVINNRTLPQYSWTVGQDGAIRVETDTTPLVVKLWQVTNPTERDFRHAFHPDLIWTSTTLTASSPGVYSGNVPMPSSGATAYMVQLTFPNSNTSPIPLISSPYVFTTEVRVKSTLPMTPWPFESAFDTNSPLVQPAAAMAKVDNGSATSNTTNSLNAIASALAFGQETFDASDDILAPLAPPAAEASPLVLPATDSPLISSNRRLTSLAWNDLIQDDSLADDLLDESLTEMLA